MISYILSEGCRRFIQLVFSSRLFNCFFFRRVKYFFMWLSFGILNPAEIGDHVVLYRSHFKTSDFSDGTRKGKLRLGNKVKIGKKVNIDYCGNVSIGDRVEIGDDVLIFSHSHKLCGERVYHTAESILVTRLEIGQGAVIGSNSIILPSVSYIGCQAKIEPNSVVTRDVPDYAVVAGNPARIVEIN